MTVIAVKKEGDKVIFGCDELTVSNKKGSVHDLNATKIGRISNDFAIGGAGLFSEIVLLQQYALMHLPRDNNLISIIEYMNEFYAYKQKLGYNYAPDAYYIIYYKGKIYESIKHSINEIANFTAIGSGSDYAYTALHLGKSVNEAVQVA